MDDDIDIPNQNNLENVSLKINISNTGLEPLNY
jgi:hypothetical protein